MNKTLLNIVVFAVGAAVGSAVTWQVLKTKYEQIADEEIASVKEEYAELMGKMKAKLKETATYDGPQDADEARAEEVGEYEEEIERDRVAYHKITSNYSSSETTEEGGEWDQDEDEVPYINGPYVITPEDFSCSPPGYNAQPLDYFADGVLADSWGVVLDLDETIGEDAVNHFGEYADDIVYVRNERKEVDYEVSKDPRTYQDMVKTNPDPYYGTYEN